MEYRKRTLKRSEVVDALYMCFSMSIMQATDPEDGFDEMRMMEEGFKERHPEVTVYDAAMVTAEMATEALEKAGMLFTPEEA